MRVTEQKERWEKLLSCRSNTLCRFIDYRGFLDIVRDPDAKLIDLEDEIESEQSGSGSSTNKVATGFKFQKIEPKGEDLLQELRVRLQLVLLSSFYSLPHPYFIHSPSPLSHTAKH